MATPGYEMDVIRKIVSNTGGPAIVVRPDADALGLVLVENEELDSEWLLSPEQARVLADALVECAAEMDVKNDLESK